MYSLGGEETAGFSTLFSGKLHNLLQQSILSPASFLKCVAFADVVLVHEYEVHLHSIHKLKSYIWKILCGTATQGDSTPKSYCYCVCTWLTLLITSEFST